MTKIVVPIDQLKDAIEYLEKKKLNHNDIPVFKWRIKDKAVSAMPDPSVFVATYPINELTFEYSFRYREWQLITYS